jgi:hypothetical protein
MFTVQILSIIILAIASAAKEPILALSLDLTSSKNIETTFAIGSSEVRGTPKVIKSGSILTMSQWTSAARTRTPSCEQSTISWSTPSSKPKTIIAKMLKAAANRTILPNFHQSDRSTSTSMRSSTPPARRGGWDSTSDLSFYHSCPLIISSTSFRRRINLRGRVFTGDL